MTKKEMPLWQLSAEEFINLLKENGMCVTAQVETQPTAKKETNYIYGLDGLAKLLGCSKVTAQKIKNSTKLEGCYFQVNRKLVFDVDLVKNALKGK